MHHRVIVFVLLALGALSALPAQERFESMRVGTTSYTNVFVLSKTPADLFFTHSLGLSNVKVKDLEDEIKSQLGYQVDGQPEVRRRSEFKMKAIEMDPRLKAWKENVTRDVGAKFQSTARNVLLGFLSALVLIYFFFCYCCQQICEKAGAPSPFLVWIPGLQLLCLFKAARLPRWAISALFAPQIAVGLTQHLLPEDLSLHSPRMMTLVAIGALAVLISLTTAIIWAVKLCKARNKTAWLAVLLLFPPTSVFTFLYLAFSNGEERGIVGNPSFVSFS